MVSPTGTPLRHEEEAPNGKIIDVLTSEDVVEEIETNLTALERLCEQLDEVPNVGRPEVQFRIEEVQFRLSKLDDRVGERIMLE